MADVSTAEPDTVARPEPTPDPAAGRRDPPARAIAIVVSVLATLIGLIFLAWLVLFVTKGRFLKHTFERIASQNSGRTVRVAGDFNLYFDPFATKFLAEGLTVSNPAWASRPNLFQAKLVDARIDTFSFLFGNHAKVNWINLVDGAIDTEWDKTHQHNSWTLGDPDQKGKPFHIPLIQRARITGTTVRYRDPVMQLGVDVAVGAIRASDSRFGDSIRFDGTGTLRGNPLRLWGQQTAPNTLIASGANQFELHVDAAKTRIDIAGTLPGATVIDGADLSVAARGSNIRNLFDLIGVAVPDTRTYTLRGHMTKEDNLYRFTRLTGTFGTSDIGGTLTVKVPQTLDDRVRLDADLVSRHADIIDLGPFIGYDPKALASKGPTAAATTQGPRGSYPRILPDAPLRSDAIKAFDATVSYRIADIKEPFVPISNILLKLDLDHSLLKLSPLNFDMAGGHVTSDISIDAREPAVATEYDIRMSPTPMGKLFARFGVADSGTTGTIKARIKMHGTGDSLRKSLATSNGRIAIILPRGTFWTQYVQLSEFDVGVFIQKMFEKKLKQPVQVNCGLIGFTVRDGIAAADPILIDTTKNVMTAKGGFSFKDESLSLAFRADAKKFSLFSGQSPIGINGHFAAPGIQILSPQLIARGGAAVALGVVATPLASVLAFVDPGDAKAAQCGPVLAGATAAAQRTIKGDPRKDVGNGTTKDVKAEKKDKKFLGIKL